MGSVFPHLQHPTLDGHGVQSVNKRHLYKGGVAVLSKFSDFSSNLGLQNAGELSGLVWNWFLDVSCISLTQETKIILIKLRHVCFLPVTSLIFPIVL